MNTWFDKLHKTKDEQLFKEIFDVMLEVKFFNKPNTIFVNESQVRNFLD